MASTVGSGTFGQGDRPTTTGSPSSRSRGGHGEREPARTRAPPPPPGTKTRMPRHVSHTRPDKFTETGYRWGFSRARPGTVDATTGARLPGLAAYKPTLSDHHPRLPTHDPKSHGLIAGNISREEAAEAERRAGHAAERTRRLREHLRRKAERETIENYVQNPYVRDRGLRQGVDVFDAKIRFLWARMEHAKEQGAIDFLGRLQKFMRQHQLRAIDLFDLVDESGDGCIDQEELMRACAKVHMPCNAKDAQKLFEFLDTSGDGLIGPDELESAIRMYRRFKWENVAIQQHFASMTRAKYTRDIAEAHLKYAGKRDQRASASLQKVVMPGRLEDGVPRAASLPLVGQQLMGMQDPELDLDGDGEISFEERMALEANRTSLSEGTTGKGAEPSMFSEQYDRSLARIQAKDRAYNEGLRSRKEARRAETLERMHRQIRNRKDMEQTVANWT